MTETKFTKKTKIAELIEQFYDNFPEFKNNIFILDTEKYGSIEEYMKENKEFSNLFHDYQNEDEQNKIKNSVNYAIEENDPRSYLIKKPFGKFICFLLPISPIKQMETKAPIEITKVLRKNHEEVIEAIFYHEVGHAIYSHIYGISPGFFSTENQRDKYEIKTEAFAESYAFIRMHQSVGIEHPLTQGIMQFRTLARQRKQGLDPHNFLPSIHEVMRLAKTGELENLSPHESVNLARDISEKFALTPKDANHIEKKLSSVYNNFTKNKSDIAIKQLQKVAKTTSNMATLKDIQYTVQFIEDVSFYPEDFKQKISTVWDALSQNKQVKKHGYAEQHWRASEEKPLNRPKL